MKSIKAFYDRVNKLVAAAVLLLAAGIPTLLLGFADAGQLTVRSIQLGDSNSGATTSYHVKFTPAQTTTIGGIVVDICDDSPLIGLATCTYPTGFSWGAAGTLTGSLTVNSGMGTGWTATGVQGGSGAASASQTFELSNATPQTLTLGTPADFTVASVKNPTTANHSYYARILTFDTSGNMTSQYTVGTSTTRATSFANNKDYGGVALSTGTVFNITAKVQETLSFCVYNTTCGDVPDIQLGAGPNGTLNTTQDTKTVKFSVSTNANGNGASASTIINMRGDTLKYGTNTIPAAGATAVALSSATGGYGMRISAAGSGVTAQAPYNDAANFGLDITTANNNITATYGDTVASIIGPVNASVTTMTFAAIASATTPAGIYTAAEQFVATGTF